MRCSNFKLKRYIRRVSNALPCCRQTKKQIVAQIRTSLEDYLQKNPNADLKMVQLHFGTPEEIAASYIAEQDASVLLHKMRIKKKVLAIVTGTMTIIFLMWLVSVAWATIDAHKAARGYYEVIIEKDGNN